MDGNKRIGAHVMLVFLALNGIELEYEQNELSDLFLGIADGKLGYTDTLIWITSHM
jgi:death-on-curing protein